MSGVSVAFAKCLDGGAWSRAFHPEALPRRGAKEDKAPKASSFHGQCHGRKRAFTSQDSIAKHNEIILVVGDGKRYSSLGINNSYTENAFFQSIRQMPADSMLPYALRPPSLTPQMHRKAIAHDTTLMSPRMPDWSSASPSQGLLETDHQYHPH